MLCTQATSTDMGLLKEGVLLALDLCSSACLQCLGLREKKSRAHPILSRAPIGLLLRNFTKVTRINKKPHFVLHIQIAVA